MAATLPTPPPELPNPPSAPSREALLDNLDTLLERYLHLLDEYQAARQQLQKQLSAGYISLAQANFSAPRGVRYGRDCYDERMGGATRRVAVSTSDNRQTIKIEVPESTMGAADISPAAAITSKDDAEEPRQPEVHPADPTQPIQQEHPKPKNPITMFGILTPPALRAAQSSFVKAVEGPVPRLVELGARLRALEVEVGRARKALRKAEG
ncbi:hypothetical protein W97_05721 [Coniosporium apollinis CBS 100218]|uniref:Vacuolar ATPase assembly protein VMA22 n=1 Tax=Coniosporium apollinis (strain CBS 100218) TaxID=1168221 RepID=R7YWV5_CONA1|nr:uncharacterized protein W97_05721 [Coniosporium apollinis CBS 100218]EON66328.1 hypothetical protein W97_05721 [Coniosporium apollinis CBS 100218]